MIMMNIIMTMMTTMAMTMIAAVGTMVVIVLLMVTAVGMVVGRAGWRWRRRRGGGDARVASLLGAGIIPKPCRDWCVAGGLFERSAAGKANLRSTE